jgi:hypothetical protein
MPDDHGDLARDGDGRNVRAAATGNSFIEPSWRARPPYRLPSSFDQHASGVIAALLGNTAMLRRPVTGLVDARVQTEIGDKLIRSVEPDNRTNGCRQAERDDHVDPRDRHEPLNIRVGQSGLCELPFDCSEIFTQPIVLAQMPLHGITFVGWKRLANKPTSPPAAEQICVGTPR